MSGEDEYSVLEPEIHGIGGVIKGLINFRDQDEVAEPGTFYVVTFFPRVDGIGKANLEWPDTTSTLSYSPEAAITKFLDRHPSAKHDWDQHVVAGWKVRKVRVVDLGDAE